MLYFLIKLKRKLNIKNFYLIKIIGIDIYLWFIGGNECINSNDVFIWFLLRADRCLTNASHKINKKNITEITEIIEPILEITFQNINLSG